jgi:uncharacterized protein YegJ (DUF2314 family)
MRFALIVLLVFACSRPSDPSLVYRDADDPEISAAQRTAQTRWNEFTSATDPRAARFVKVPLGIRGGVGREHVWLKVIAIDGDNITGVLDSKPVEDVGYQAGDTIATKRADVEDWLISKNGATIGNFTRAALERY